LARDLIEVRAMPELLGLLDHRLDEMRMRVAEHGDGDAAREIEVLLAVVGKEVGALAPLESEIIPSVGRQNGWNHGTLLRGKGLRISESRRASVVVVTAPPLAIPSASGRDGQSRASWSQLQLRPTAPKKREPDAESAGV